MASGEDIYVEILADHLDGGGLEEYAAGSGRAGGILSGIFPKDRRLQKKRKSCSMKKMQITVLLYYSAKIADIIFDNEKLMKRKSADMRKIF